jgi:hypothetical protein
VSDIYRFNRLHLHNLAKGFEGYSEEAKTALLSFEFEAVVQEKLPRALINMGIDPHDVPVYVVRWVSREDGNGHLGSLEYS